MPLFLLPCALLALALPVSGQSPPSTGAWPAWRGGDAQGVASAQALPGELAPGGATMRWKATVRGRGISSPIVVGDRVFVTTAHRYEGGLLRWKTNIVITCSALALLAGALLLLYRDRSTSWLERIDTALAAISTSGFVTLAITATLSPNTLWELGRPGEAWLVTGAILLLGIAAASGWTLLVGRLRLLLTTVLIAIGVLLWLGVPLDRYGIEHGTGPRTLMIVPGVLFVGWTLLARWLGAKREPAARPGTRVAMSAGGAFIAFAALVLFASVNTWERDERLARSLMCFDLATGQTLWERVLLIADKEQKWPKNSFATPTPCSDGERVFAYFGAGYACVDLDGHVLWSGDDGNYVPHSRYGAGASPIVDGDQILLWQENEGKSRKSYLVSLDWKTGAVNWRVEPDDVHDSYSTPILIARPNGERELVTMAYRKIVAHSTKDGTRLWELKIPARQVVPSLCYAGDGLLLASGGTHLEFSTSGVRLDGSGTATTPEVKWQTRRNLSDICSPVFVDGLFFTVIDGKLRCLDPETGKIHWTQRIGEGDYWASLIAGDGKVYALSEDGKLTTAAVDAARCRVLAETEFGETCMATPAAAGGRVLVRTEGSLYCFGTVTSTPGR